MNYRVLIVDDYAPWRRHVESMLHDSDRWHVVGEATDGLEAISRAGELRPDLVLLDVGLPQLNGLQAAPRIRAVHPGCRILFMSAMSTWDIVEAALLAGGGGFILKVDAERELVPAMDAALAGHRFVSPALMDSAHGGMEPHRVRVYSEERLLVDEFAQFAGSVLRAGKALIALAQDRRRPAFDEALSERGIDVGVMVREGRYRWLDADQAVAAVIVDGWPDEGQLWRVIGAIIADAASSSTAEHPRVAMWGEGAPALLRDGKPEAALRLEQLWHDVVKAYGLETLCAYSSEGLSLESDLYHRLCATHTSAHWR